MEKLVEESTAPGNEKETLFTRLFVNRDFAFLFGGETISQLGDNMFTITLTLWVTLVLGNQQPWLPLALGGMVLSAMLPPMVVGLFAGVFVDRWNRKVTMVVVDVLQILLVSVLIATTFMPGGHLPIAWQLGVMIGANFLLCSVDQFFNQAGFSLIRSLVPQKLQGRAISRLLFEFGLGVSIGPAIGGTVFILVGPRYALVVNALTFVVSLFTTLAVRQPARVANTTSPTTKQAAEKRPGFWSEFWAGVKFIFASRILRVMLIAMIIEGFGTAPLAVLNILFFLTNLHASAALYGFMVMTMGIGFLIGTAVAPALVNRFGETRIFWLSILGDGIFLLVYSRLTTFAPADAMIFLLGAMGGLFNVSSGPLVLRLTPDNLMGRTTAVRVALNSFATVLGVVLAVLVATTVFHGLHINVLGTTFGAIDTIFFVAGILALISGVYAMLNMHNDLPKASPDAVAAPAIAVEVVAE